MDTLSTLRGRSLTDEVEIEVNDLRDIGRQL